MGKELREMERENNIETINVTDSTVMYIVAGLSISPRMKWEKIHKRL